MCCSVGAGLILLDGGSALCSPAQLVWKQFTIVLPLEPDPKQHPRVQTAFPAQCTNMQRDVPDPRHEVGQLRLSTDAARLSCDLFS